MHLPSSRTPEGVFEYFLAFILTTLLLVSLWFIAAGLAHLP